MVGGFTIELHGIKFRDAYQEEGENKNGPLTNLICFYSYPQYHIYDLNTFYWNPVGIN